MKTFYSISVIVFLSFSSFCAAQSCHCPSMVNEEQHSIYFSAGYHRDFFTRSDLHFKDLTTANYDFTLYNVEAVDESGFKHLFNEDITIPQYAFRIGYYFNMKKNLAIEINYDHVKYVMVRYQNVHLKGMIDGINYDQDTVLVYDFLRFEHTNGANYCMLNLVKRLNFFHSKNELHWLSAVIKPGVGFLFPRTDVYIQRVRRNDKYHVAGYVLGLETGIRYDFLKNFLFEMTSKGAYANYTNDLLPYDGRGNHSFFSFEAIATIGFSLPVNYKKIN